MTAPTLPEPRPDDEGRETAPACAICGATYSGAVQGLFRNVIGEWICIGPHATPHPAPLGATAITDDDVRRAVCDYNDWKYDEMMSSVSLRDTRSLALRVVLESFAARSAPLGATDEGTVEARLIASLGQAVAIHHADRLREAVEAFFAASDMLHAIPDEDAPAVRSALDRCIVARAALRAALQAGG